MNQISLSFSHIPGSCAQLVDAVHTKIRTFFQDDRVQQVIKVSRIAVGTLALAASGACTVYALAGKSFVSGCAALGCFALGISALPLHTVVQTVCHIALETGRVLLSMASEEYEMRERENLFLSRSARDTYEPYSRYGGEERVVVGDHRSCFSFSSDDETRVPVGRR